MKKIIKGIFATLVILTVVFLMFGFVLQQSLPILEGQIAADVKQKVTIERDAQGLVALQATDLNDAVYGLGFVHAQERFFQMDLQRRRSAGRLAELFGKAAVDADKKVRLHYLQANATKAFSLLSAEQQHTLMRYSAGVNAGLAALKSAPFEYTLLQVTPERWQASDSLLVVYSMFLLLNDETAEYDFSRTIVARHFGEQVLEFLSPIGNVYDATLDGSDKSVMPIIANLNLNQIKINEKQVVEEKAIDGSNNWAVAGSLSKDGSAILADDMHLGISVPNTWFRAQLHYQDKSIVGLSLPGIPGIVVGSNGHLAWGFTNSYGDWHDRIALELDENGSHYQTPQGWQPLGKMTHQIQVKGSDTVNYEVAMTQWGAAIENDDGSWHALHWLAQYPKAVNLNLMDLMLAENVNQGISACNNAGMPPQNCVLADSQGNIGWTIAGLLPQRGSAVSNQVVPWQQADELWQGWLAKDHYPKIINPQNHRVWTANSRVVGGHMLKEIGDGGYDIGARTRQIADGLLAKASFNEQQLLAIALDDRALMLAKWHKMLMALLERRGLEGHEWYAALESFSGHAAVNDYGYSLVRRFYDNWRQDVYMALAIYAKSDSQVNLKKLHKQLLTLKQKEQALWLLATRQPADWLVANHKTFDDWLLAVLAQSAAELTDEFGSLDAATWGKQNIATIKHPLSDFMPLGLKQWFEYKVNMAPSQLPGDANMPRVQRPQHGASQRLVVSPGNEQQGILHMPAGQSGHPLAPYYGAGHKDWEQGLASPLLMGDVVWSLALTPTQ
ncbi:penicillin acylase family protein [Paraferrimonas sp. SM1919]|uniref:penicillin acylase family protein n=1 Tax=Paraferrimonas sp. SM1919 TaxID=2662263 RepID=UPI0013D490C8|nr:penicillin acylase family protein [Paraferrimonas sp. SM1919]